ncbi:MAG: UDP-N-acetylmuramoyl-L-alanyl-D-glutamate--2,6-diaminopimelate ligase [Bacteroidales bacterium]|jgi:UDP-N-acetylmuramoyl-L-alanyl-D-glutamate--2,6-diaminopimelate ligase|nr:UDP-N-acetylmuramoyl-L-alanyl-D-glutamate--2,6-diaminopimelate ligase [Bacteroidales bacterium]
MKISQLVKNLETIKIAGDTNLNVSDLTFDSREVKNSSCFFAVKGVVSDGHFFVNKAIEQGANMIVCQILPDFIVEEVCYVQVKDSNYAMGIIAGNFYDNPSKKLKLVGITGTNGKTTTVTLLYHLFKKMGYKAGLLSTIHNKVDEHEIPNTHTTPDALGLNRLLAEMVDVGCEFAFMEVSSHSVVQERIAGIHFTGGIFSNITLDHLDYHKTFDAYIKAKQGFFTQLGKNAFALTNIDDKNGEVMVQNSRAKIYTYSVKQSADFTCKVVENSFEGLHLRIDGKDVFCRLIGLFNAYNFMAIYSTALLLGADKDEVLAVMSNLTAADGRFDQVKNTKGVTAIVDYAHTPDALENVLSTLNKIRKGNEILITVVGCGGDRDRSKRPIMAKIACQLSDKVILTSDNPRTEDPQVIIDGMYAGVEEKYKPMVLKIVNREEAIHTATMLAHTNDIVLVAGKGHENYQEINHIKHHFDDKEMLNKYLQSTTNN